MILVLVDPVIKAMGATRKVVVPGSEEEESGEGGFPHEGDGVTSVAGASTVLTEGSLEDEYEKLKEGGTIVTSMAWDDDGGGEETASQAEVRKKQEAEKPEDDEGKTGRTS